MVKKTLNKAINFIIIQQYDYGDDQAHHHETKMTYKKAATKTSKTK